jgi:hypothetical protein
VNSFLEWAKQFGLDESHYEAYKALWDHAAKHERQKILGVLRRKPDQQIYKVLDELRSMK